MSRGNNSTENQAAMEVDEESTEEGIYFSDCVQSNSHGLV